MQPKPAKPPRSLKGVLEALENKNYKTVVKRTETVLHRHPSNVFCKALRAVALELSDRRQEAMILCREVKLTRPVDPQVLGHLKTVYERMGLWAEITSIYETAVEEEPLMEANAVSLFLALASEVQLARQQQVALRLYRQFKNPRYMHWAVACILLQCPSVGPHRSLDLAWTLLQRTPVSLAQLKHEGACAALLRDAHFVLLLHLATLRQQGKYSQALELLQAHKDGVPLASDFARLRLHLLAEAGASEAVAAAKAQFLQCIDQWSAAREYIFVCFRAEGFLDALDGANSADLSSEGASAAEVAASSRARSAQRSISSLGQQSPAPTALPNAGGDKKASNEPVKVELLDFVGRTGGAAATGGDAPGADLPTPPPWDETINPSRSFRTTPHANLIGDSDATPASVDAQRSGHEVRDLYLTVKHLQRTARDHGSRVPFLAELEMRALAFACSELEALHRAATSGELVDHRSWLGAVSHIDLTDFIDTIVAYFERHGHRGCCYVDLKPYFCILDEQRATTLLQKLQQAHDERATAERDGGGWAARCAETQRHLVLFRAKRGLRALQDVPLQRAAAEVNELLLQWESLRQLNEREGIDFTTRLKGHGLREEMRPTVDVDDLLALATAHLLDMDRDYCRSLASAASGRGRLPALRNRPYILDTLTILELGTKLSPFCARLRLLLAIVYGSVGAALPLRKLYEMVGMSNLQHEALTHLVLDRLLALGWWEDVPDLCGRLLDFHKQFERDTRAELANVYQEEGARALHRSREYIRMLDIVGRSVMRGRAIVEHAVVELIKLPSCKEMLTFLGQHVEQIREVAHKPIGSWAVTETQERGLYQGLHYLPRCTPLQALHMGAIGAPHIAQLRARVGFRSPPNLATVFRPLAPLVVVSAAASAWPTNTDAETSGLPPPQSGERSGLEDLMAPRREASPALLKLRALLLLMVHAMLQPTPSETELSELLHEFQGALASEGIAAHCDPGIPFHGASGDRDDAFATLSSRRPGSADKGRSSRPTSIEAPERLRRASQHFGLGSTLEASGTQRSPQGISNSARRCSSMPDGTAATGRDEEFGSTLETSQLGVEDPQIGWPPPWRVALATADDLFWRCSLVACDVVHRTIWAAGLQDDSAFTHTGHSSGRARQSIGFEEDGDLLLAELVAPSFAIAWDALCRGLAVLRILIRECACVVLLGTSPAGATPGFGQSVGAVTGGGVGAGGTQPVPTCEEDRTAVEAMAHGEPFRLGGHGLPTLSAFMTGPLLILVPMALFVASRLAKSDAGIRFERTRSNDDKHRIAGDARAETMETARIALVELIEELQAVLKELLQGLLGAQAEGFDHLGGGSGMPSAPQVDFFSGRAPAGVDLEKLRRAVGNNLVGSFKRQLAALEDSLRGRIDLLKAVTFKRDDSTRHVTVSQDAFGL